MKPFKAIVAVSENNVIGINNALPWHLPDDLKFFKEMTSGHNLLMGRKTFLSIGKPLPNRHSFVLSTSMAPPSPPIPNLTIINSLSHLPPLPDKTLWIIGGAEIYKLTLPYCSDLFITHVKQSISNGDTFFPPYQHLFHPTQTLQDTPTFKIIHYHNPTPLPLPQNTANDLNNMPGAAGAYPNNPPNPH